MASASIAVIASAAKQSIHPLGESLAGMDCFVALLLAMTGVGRQGPEPYFSDGIAELLI